LKDEKLSEKDQSASIFEKKIKSLKDSVAKLTKQCNE